MKKILTLLISTVLSTTLMAQSVWPVKPVKIIIPYAVGGDLELLTRKAEKNIEQELKQPVLIEIKPGASGNIGASELAKANGDGYTWMIALDAIVTSNPYVLPASFNVNDIRPITFIATRSSVLLCRPDLNIKSFKDFVEVAKTKNLSYAHSGTGNVSYMLMEAIKSQYKLDIIPIPYQGVAPALQSVVSKQVDCVFSPAAPAIGSIQAGLVTPVVYSGEKRSVLFSDLPTLKELGYKGMNGNVYFTLYANKGTPEHIVTKMLTVIENSFKNQALITEAKAMDHSILVTTTKETETKISEIISVNHK